MIVYIPRNFDIEKFEDNHNLKTTIKHYKRDKLAYILYLINKLLETKKADYFNDGFVKINAQVLQKSVKECKSYLKFLIANDIVQIIGYVPDKHSTLYRFAPDYSIGVKPYEIKNFTFKRNLERWINKNNKYSGKYSFLRKWFNSKFQINTEFCSLFIEKEFQLKTNFPELVKVNRFGSKKNIIDQYNGALIHIDRYSNSDFQNFVVDANGYRFHSILTNTRSMLRNGLSYNGEKLVSTDISNSQPFLSILLFSKVFWDKKAQFYKNQRIKEIINKIIVNNNIKSLPLMLATISEILDKPDVLMYKDLVCAGQFYEYFEKEYYNRTGLHHSDRGVLKSEMFLVLFSKNSYVGRKDTKGKDIFAEIFPNVYRLFEIIKTGDNTLLPLLLQRIESLIVLDDICFNISEEYPHVPLFTIHDSIITTENYADLIHSTMDEKLQQWIGYKPTLKVEKWDLALIDEYYNDLVKQSVALQVN